jgi:hypothetical protein
MSGLKVALNVLNCFLPGIIHVLVEKRINLPLIQFTTVYNGKGQDKITPLQARTSPYGYRSLRLPEFLDYRRMKVVRLSALLIGRLYPLSDIAGTHFCSRLSRHQGYSAVGGKESMKNLRTPILPACNAVLQPTAPPRIPHP